jgi:fatty acid CoA ligase FadD9
MCLFVPAEASIKSLSPNRFKVSSAVVNKRWRNGMPEPREAQASYPQNVLDLARHDAQLQALIPASDLFAQGAEPSIRDVVEVLTRTYSERPALGYRAYEIDRDLETGDGYRRLLSHFDTLSYRELGDRLRRLAAAWRDHPRHHVDPGDFVCLLGFTGVDFITLFLGCAYAQAVSVPLQTTLGGDLGDVIASTAPTCVAATIDDIVAAAEMAVEHSSIRSIIAFDHDPKIASERRQLDTARAILDTGSKAELITLDDLLATRAVADWTPLPPAPQGMERMALLIHSSGSTGKPKGAIHSERLAVRSLMSGNMMAGAAKAPGVPCIKIALGPMNHLMGQTQVMNTLGRGGTVYFTARPDLSTVFEDIRLARPTELSLFPRIMDVIYGHFLAEVARSGDDAEPADVRARVMADMRTSFLGDRLCAIVTGTAPTAPEVKQFMTECFQVPLTEGYGMTEIFGSILLNGRIVRSTVIDYKLRDVPELGYLNSDRPYPRGELCVKSNSRISGYFKQPELSAKLFDDEGFYRTGDVMEERGPDQLVYIDRVNDVLKLAQGEFVAVGALGVIFEDQCPAIAQIYPYGNSARPYLLAVIVPNMQVVLKRLGPDPDEAAIRGLLRGEMRAAGEKAGLRSFEIPRDFIIEHEPFSFKNGLLTSVRKRRRPALKARYGDALEALYAAQETNQSGELRALRGDDRLSGEEKVTMALEALLGIDAASVDPSRSFKELGGDSLGAVSFALLLDDIFDVEISVNTILSPTGNVRSWARTIEAARLGLAGGLPSYGQIHGTDRSQVRADDLDVTVFLDNGTLDAIPADPPECPSRCVLLTGATGYLGRFLCLEWLERLATRGGKLICLLRASDEAAALKRLTAGFASDPALAKRFETLASHHLELLVGDVAEPRLGLDEATVDRLARDVDHIVHCGALVNHMLPYTELFQPNVAGTAQLVRLALTHRQKQFDFISSVAVCSLLDANANVTEATPIRRNLTLKNSYAEGYGISKWAGEHLLHDANARFGLPVNIFRCGMILANRDFAGQLNLPDTLTRLLYSIVVTGTAPRSFYEPASGGGRQPGHYDGLPVDFVAAAIAGIGDLGRPRKPQTFHVRNHNADAHVSLDTFVDWIEEAGYGVEREADYARWLALFKARLENLPEDQRQRSVLPVLDSIATPQRPSQGVDSAEFVQAVGRLPLRRVPCLDRELLRKYLSDLRLLQLIPAPASVRAESLAVG